MLERRQPSLLKKVIPSLLGFGMTGRDSAELDGITPSFQVNLGEGSIATQSATPTFTRATTATVTDHDSVVRNVLSGEARFQGLRRVQNLVTASEDITGGSWISSVSGTGTAASATSGFTAPDGSSTAFRILAHRGAGVTSSDFSFWIPPTVTFAVTTPCVNAVWIKSNTGVNQNVALRLTSFGASDVVVATPTWQRLSISYNTGVGTVAGFGIGTRNTFTDQEIDVLIWHPQWENTTGQSVTTPSEYVSVGVLSAPYHGANVDGVKYFPRHNGNVVQQNLLLRSQEFDNASWSKGNSTITADATTAPDGTTTADLRSTTLDSGSVSQNVTITSGATVTASLYFKAGNANFQRIRLGVGADATSAWVDLRDGTVTHDAGAGGCVFASARATAYANGWYRLELTVTTSGGTTLALNTYTSSTGSSSSLAGQTGYVWGAQINYGTRASTYVATTTAAVNNNIVEEQSGAAISTSTRLGYLAEGARTNLCLQSEDFSNASWTKTDTTITANNVVAPDGATTADLFTEGSAGTALVEQSITGTAAANYSWSGFFKYGNTAWLRLQLGDGANNAVAWFNIQTGVLGSTAAAGTGAVVSSKITAYPNGWYRCELVGSVGGAITSILSRIFSVSADGGATRVNGATKYVWGAQFENNVAFASTYIPTTTATVTRNADVLTYPTTGWLNAAAGTVVVQATAPADPLTSAFARVVSLNDGTANEEITLERNSGVGRFFVVDGGVQQVASILGSWADSASSKIAAAYKLNDFAAVIDAGTVQTDAAGTLPSLSSLSVGCSGSGAAYLGGPISRVAYYPRRLPDAILQRLTR